MYQLSANFFEFVNREEFRKDNKVYLVEIIDNIGKDDFGFKRIQEILQKYNIPGIKYIKEDSLNFLISYADFILSDGVISELEQDDFTALKIVFKIKEGDFMKLRPFETVEILKKEFIRIYSDNYVDSKEELLNVNLQTLFNLSYDQFEEIKKEEVIRALLLGANPKDLDISMIPKGFIFKDQ